jgi:hypothetical protein
VYLSSTQTGLSNISFSHISTENIQYHHSARRKWRFTPRATLMLRKHQKEQRKQWQMRQRKWNSQMHLPRPSSLIPTPTQQSKIVLITANDLKVNLAHQFAPKICSRIMHGTDLAQLEQAVLAKLCASKSAE